MKLAGDCSKKWPLLMVKLAETTALLHRRNIRSQTVRALWCHGFPWQSTLLGKGLWTSLTATWLRWEHWESTPVYCPQQPQAAQKLPFWVPRTMHADRRWFARHVREKWRGVHWVRLIVIGRSWDVLDCLEYLRISPYISVLCWEVFGSLSALLSKPWDSQKTGKTSCCKFIKFFLVT